MQIQAAHSGYRSDSQRARIGKAAQEFEAMLLTSLLNSVQKTLVTLPGNEQDPVAQSYGQFAVETMAAAVSAAGGLGISRMLLAKLMK
ncbi:MAG TPA: hypothetical protein VFA68_01325 [Terriglobales bacterium]|nr:hypothetical protein [Terriglobales bacterium]